MGLAGSADPRGRPLPDFHRHGSLRALCRRLLKERLSKVGFLVCKDGWSAKDGPEDRFFNVDSNGLATIWVYSGRTNFHAIPPALDFESPAR